MLLRALDRLNTRHPFSHNDHFHPWILRNLPERRRRALDVGCGEGLLAAALGTRFERVDAADVDAGMRAATARRCAGLPVTVVDGFAAAAGPYDLITMVAALHHLELEPALRRCRDLLAPGGRLLIVGLAKAPSATPGDLVWELASALANPVMGFVRHPRPYRGPKPAPPFPVTDPAETFAEIARAAAVLPGAVLRRRVPFRYTLAWTRGG